MNKALSAMNWDDFALRYWNRAAAVVPCPAPVPLQRAYDAIVTASVPFRAGTRFFTLPDVRLFVTEGRLRAPGGLLPDAADATAEDYVKRLDADLPGSGYLLAVEEPLMLDFALWFGVRNMISGLWRQIGWPDLPVSAELAVGSGDTHHDALTSPPQHATMVWVLRGTALARLWPECSGPPPAAVAEHAADVSGMLTLDCKNLGRCCTCPRRTGTPDLYSGLRRAEPARASGRADWRLTRCGTR